MDVLTDDHEREEAVKKWWKEYWKPITLGVVIALGGLLGFRQYQSYQLSLLQDQALKLYNIQKDLRHDGVNAIDKANEFITANQDIYGSLLALDVASLQINAGKYDDAIESVNFAKKNGGNLVSTQATILEARLYAQKKEIDKAISLLDGVDKEVYGLEVYETLGDIYLAKGDKDSAHDNYKKAIDIAYEKKIGINPILQMKFDNLIKEGEKPAFKLSQEIAQ